MDARLISEIRGQKSTHCHSEQPWGGLQTLRFSSRFSHTAISTSEIVFILLVPKIIHTGFRIVGKVHKNRKKMTPVPKDTFSQACSQSIQTDLRDLSNNTPRNPSAHQARALPPTSLSQPVTTAAMLRRAPFRGPRGSSGK